jgi:hypothetical protein
MTHFAPAGKGLTSWVELLGDLLMLPGLLVFLWALAHDRLQPLRELWRGDWSGKLVALALLAFLAGVAMAISADIYQVPW